MGVPRQPWSAIPSSRPRRARGRRLLGLTLVAALAIAAGAAGAPHVGEWLEALRTDTGDEAPEVVVDSDAADTDAAPVATTPPSQRQPAPPGEGGPEDTDDPAAPEETTEDETPGDEATQDPGDAEDEASRERESPGDEAPADTDEDEGPPAEEDEPTVDLATVQARLRDLGFLVGPADGVMGSQTRAAVMAFQRVNGLQVDGVVGPQTLGALEDPRAPELRGGPPTRIEVDLTRQLLHLVEGGQRTATLHVSSGNGQPYTTSSGGTAYANTPVGEFVIERRIAGARRADLGTLYDPLYYYRGWAIHGSSSVPAHPASHGCIRVTRADGTWLFEQVPNGTPVHVYGGQHTFVPGR